MLQRCRVRSAVNSTQNNKDTIGKCSLPGQPRQGEPIFVESNFLSSESRSWGWTGFAALPQLRAANTLSAPCPGPRLHIQRNLSAEDCFQPGHPSICFHTGHRTMPSPFGPNPLIWPRGNSGKTLRHSDPIRAFTTETSEELGVKGLERVQENDTMLGNKT